MSLPSDIIYLKNFLRDDLRKLIVSEIEIFMTCSNHFGDVSGYVDNSFNWYSPPSCEALMLNLLPQIERSTNLKLYPTYSYARVYKKGSELKKHLDRKSSEIAVTCCLERTEPYEFHIDDGTTVHSFDMKVGDVLIFPGRKYYHWRNKYYGSKHIHCFLQYVNADGDLKEYKYDTRPYLGFNYEFTSEQVKNEMQEYYK